MVARLSIALALLVACGSDPKPFVPSGAVDYCEAIEPFFCDFYVRCGRMAVADVASCKDAFLTSCNAVFEPRYVELEAAGLLALDLDGIAACEAHLETVACDQQIQELDGPCGTMWVGQQPAGASCGLDVEFFVCAPGNGWQLIGPSTVEIMGTSCLQLKAATNATLDASFPCDTVIFG